MNPRTPFCHNPSCSATGTTGQGNIVVHSRKEACFRCTLCGVTFAATQSTVFFRLQTDRETVSLVLTWIRLGCPPQPIVGAFGFDERTLAHWQLLAGQPCERFHQH